MKRSKEAFAFNRQNQQLGKTVFLVIALVVLSLFLGLLPTLSFGQGPGFGDPYSISASPAQPALQAGFGGNTGNSASPSMGGPGAYSAGNPVSSGLSMTPPAPNPSQGNAPKGTPFGSPGSGGPVPGQTMRGQAGLPGGPANLAGTASRTPVLPGGGSGKDTAKVSSPAFQEPTSAQIKENPELVRSAPAKDHPFVNYFNLPRDPNTLIKGKPISVAELLNSTRNPSTRYQLLCSYWELAGLLAEYNMRCDAEARVGMWYNEAKKTGNAQRENYLGPVIHLTRNQRISTEIEFVKKQYQLAERLRPYQGFRSDAKPEETLPIPCDYPIVKKYETYVDRIAGSGRSQYVGRMIPLENQLIEARKTSFLAAENIMQANMNDTANLVSSLNQRTEAYVGLIDAVVGYNRMIAEYASETNGSNISQYRFLRAVLELPNVRSIVGEQPREKQTATPGSRNFSGGPVGDFDVSSTPNPTPSFRREPRTTFAPDSPSQPNFYESAGARPSYSADAQALPQPAPQPGPHPGAIHADIADDSNLRPGNANPGPVRQASFVEEQ